MKCELVERHVESVLDGEVDASVQVDFDRHVMECRECQERVAFAKAFRSHLKGAVGRPAASESLKARVQRALEDESHEVSVWPAIQTNWRGTSAVAAAAALLFVLGGTVRMTDPSPEVSEGLPLLADVMNAHQASMVGEVREREAVPSYFEQRVNFPVRALDFEDPGVRFVGAGYTHVAGRRAATLHYDAHGRRVTVVAFRSPVKSPAPLEQAEAQGRAIRYFRVGGHAVPVVVHDGTMYAVVGDMDGEDRLAIAARASLH